MLALRGDAEAHGGHVRVSRHPSSPDRLGQRGLVIETGGPAPMRLAAGLVVNAAGLGAQAFARSIAGMPVDKIPPLHLAKGNYFSLSGRSPFSRLIYPMPTPGGLGVHLTLDLAGQAKFGPDVEWVDAIDYDVDPRTSAVLLRRDPNLLARPAGGRAAAGLCRRPAEDRAARRLDHRISSCRPKRITAFTGLINLFGIEFAWADGEPGDCGLAGAPRHDRTREKAPEAFRREPTRLPGPRQSDARPRTFLRGLALPHPQSPVALFARIRWQRRPTRS